MKLILCANIKRTCIFLVGVSLVQNLKIAAYHFGRRLAEAIVKARKKVV